MNIKPVGIIAIDFELGTRVIPNSYFESYLDTSDEWIRNKIGIKERKYVTNDKSYTDLAYEAAKKVMEKSNTKPEDIDLIIASTITPDHLKVASACLLQYKLGAVNAAAFDLSNGGCPGSVYSLVTASKFIADGTYKKVLVVSGEIFSKAVNMNDRGICVYFGDGVGAAILSEVPKNYGILAHDLGADGSGYYALAAPAGGSRMPLNKERFEKGLQYAKMDGKAIWNFATHIFKETILKSLKRADLSIDNLDFIISHQANYNIIVEGMKSLNLGMDKTYIDIDKCGNTGGASVYIALAEAYRKGKMKKGDVVALVAFGGGLAYGSIVLRWNLER